MRLIPSLFSHLEPRASSPGTAVMSDSVPGSTPLTGCGQGIPRVCKGGIYLRVWYTYHTHQGGIYRGVHTLHTHQGGIYQGVHTPPYPPGRHIHHGTHPRYTP